MGGFESGTTESFPFRDRRIRFRRVLILSRWAHEWRAILRCAVFKGLERRRDSYRGISEGVDRYLAAAWFNHANNPQWATHAAMILGGAEITAGFRAKRGWQENDRCRWCGEEESAYHRFWQCTRWQETRELWQEHMHVLELPRLLMHFGIAMQSDALPPILTLLVQGLLISISVQATHAEKEGDPDQCPPLPVPEDAYRILQSLRGHKGVREPRLQHYSIQMEDTQQENQPNVMQVGPHMVKQEGGACECDWCGLAVAGRDLSRYVKTPCQPGARAPPLKRHLEPTGTQMPLWKIPKHAGLAHDYEGGRGREIRCKICGAAWLWSQRHRLAKSVCQGSKHEEHARRSRADDMLPLQHNGHMPMLHPRRNHIACMNCGKQTKGDTIRSLRVFRRPCPGIPP